MSKVSIAVGNEFPLNESEEAQRQSCRHHGRHHRHGHRHGYRHGRHHGGALFFLPVLAAGITAGIYYPLWTLAGAGALIVAALIGHGIWHLFRRNTKNQDGA